MYNQRNADRKAGGDPPRSRPGHSDKRIRVVARQAKTLARFAQLWKDFDEDERIDFAMEWSNTMSHLTDLEDLYRAGDLTDAQVRTYEPVRRRVSELVPTMEHLELPTPLVSLD